EIIGHGHCTAGVNDNNTCTDQWRDLTSRAFWVSIHQDWFITSGPGLWGLAPHNDPNDPDYPDANARFLREAYSRYLQKRPPDPGGFAFWYNTLLSNGYGNPANADGVLYLIHAFLHSGAPDGYRQRFGAP